MIDSHDIKRKSGGPSDFEQRRTRALLDAFMRDQVSKLYTGPGQVRYRLRQWHIELYEAQAHPVHPDRAVRLPLALLQGAPDGKQWRLYHRGQNGHWQPYPEDPEAGTVAPPLRLNAALQLIAQDEWNLFW